MGMKKEKIIYRWPSEYLYLYALAYKDIFFDIFLEGLSVNIEGNQH